MQSYAEMVAEERRLEILRLLMLGGGEASEGMILKGLHMRGHRAGVDEDRVRQDLRDLRDRDCVVITMVDETTMLADLTKRGVRAQEGVIQVDGVARPSMGV